MTGAVSKTLSFAWPATPPVQVRPVGRPRGPFCQVVVPSVKVPRLKVPMVKREGSWIDVRSREKRVGA